MALCSSCQEFDIQSFQSDPFQLRGYPLQHVEESAGHECTFCKFLCDSLTEEILEAHRTFGDSCWLHMKMSKDHATEWKPDGRGHQYNKLTIFLAPRKFFWEGPKFFDSIIAQHEYCVVAEADSPAAASGDILGRYLGDHPKSEFHINAIRKWLSNCSAHHPACHSNLSQAGLNAESLPLPSRCIDVTGSVLVLRDTSGLRGESYVTLSHRWNHKTFRSRTTTQTLGLRHQSIDLSALPGVFRDAIWITKKLGAPYLWIDSICIIQDGDHGQDWKRQAPLMGEYFKNAFLTISAVGASSEKDGCFLERQPGIVGPLARLPYRNKEGTHQGFFYIHRRRISTVQEYHDSVQKCELLSRGWVLQEWLLSRRVVHFTSGQLFFECMTEPPMSECMETVVLDDLCSHCLSDSYWEISREFLLFNSSTGPLVKRSMGLGRTSTKDIWCQIVEVYSKLTLSRPNEDRIAALAGISSEIKPKLRSESNTTEVLFLAGLWLDDIHHGLLWECIHSNEIPALSSCGTPSWSWATYLVPVR